MSVRHGLDSFPPSHVDPHNPTDRGNRHEPDAAAENRRADAIYWAVLLVWSGLVFGAESLGALPQLGRSDAWNWIFFGAGLITLAGTAILWSGLKPSKRLWDVVWAGVLLILGLSAFSQVHISFPLILMLIGAGLFITTFLRR